MKVLTPVYVSSDIQQLVLGLPWMQSNQLSWNMKENWIELRNRRIPVHCRSKPSGPTRINGLKLVPESWTTAAMEEEDGNLIEEPKATVKLPDDWDRATIAAEQEEDIDLGWVIRRKTLSNTAPTPDELRDKSVLVKRLVTQWDRLELCDGLLTRRWMDDDKVTVRWYQLIPPMARRATLLQSAHGGTTEGPFGLRRTMKRVRRRAYWPGWTKDVRSQLKCCIPCACYKRDKLKISLGAIPIVWDEPEGVIDVAPLVVTDPQALK
jgi:hypothetical protein